MDLVSSVVKSIVCWGLCMLSMGVYVVLSAPIVSQTALNAVIAAAALSNTTYNNTADGYVLLDYHDVNAPNAELFWPI